jgi:hypothetical protein
VFLDAELIAFPMVLRVEEQLSRGGRDSNNRILIERT